jgi:capsular polysaccharide biosynthesis protein
MPFAAVFIFDSSYPTVDIALPIDDRKHHIVVSSRRIEPPPRHSCLQLKEEKGLYCILVNLRSLRDAWAKAAGERSIVVSAPEVRSAQLWLNIIYAFSLSRNVSFFDGKSCHSIRSIWRRLLKATIVASARTLLGGLNLRLKINRFNRGVRSLPGFSTREGNLFGLYTTRRSFSLPLDRVALLEDGKSLYGNTTGGWYLPAFSSRRQRYEVGTTRHALRDVTLHVETRAGAEVSALFQNEQILDYPYFLSRSRSRDSYPVSTRFMTTSVERGICLLAYTSGYYHWLLEGVPRILDVIDDGFDFDHYPLILPPLAPYQRQLLELLGIDADRQVITIGEGDWCHVDDCIFPTAYFPFGTPHLEDPSGQPSRALLLRVRERILERFPPLTATGTNTPQKIYISRAKAAKRKLTPANEAAVVSVLEQAGYQTVYLEDLPWRTQVRLLAGAESIVGFHGAGLTNILFSKAKSLLEFHNPLEARPYFAVMARELDIDYAYLIGSLEGASPNFDNVTLTLQTLGEMVAVDPKKRFMNQR